MGTGELFLTAAGAARRGAPCLCPSQLFPTAVSVSAGK